MLKPVITAYVSSIAYLRCIHGRMAPKKRKSEEPAFQGCEQTCKSASRTVTVKCSLARLQCHPDLLFEIEDAVRRLHDVAIRGSLVATQTVLDALNGGEEVPAVHDQQWWYRCFTACGTLTGRRPGCRRESKERQPCKDEGIERAAQSLFGHLRQWTPLDYMWSFVNELARDSLTCCQNMLASVFHAQLEKAVRREVIIWCLEHGRDIPKASVWRIVRHYVRLATGHDTPGALDVDDLPLDLGRQLEGLIKTWKSKYSAILPCPHATFITNDTKHQKTQMLVNWMYDLQRHRACCLQHVANIIPPDQDPSSILGKSAKPVALLPVHSFQVKHLGLSPSGLNQLLASGGMKSRETAQEGVSALPSFFESFPGLHRFQRGGRLEFANYMRVDGVCASLVFDKFDQTETNPNGCTGKRVKPSSKKVAKEDSSVRPIMPSAGQRLVAIDPGRRDLIAAVTPEGEKFKMSLKSFRHNAGTKRVASYSQRLLERHLCSDGIPLLRKLEGLPCRRNLDDWPAYTSAITPLLVDIAAAYKARGLRRWRFRAYQLRDRTLDQLCSKIIGKSPQTVLVAFGNANSCSTGFGYAPAPQGRLRRRLSRIHGARVCLIDEFRTSRCCSNEGCHRDLRHAYASALCADGLRRSIELHAVLCCDTCLNPKGHRLHWHRDFNAAQNIMTCYLAEAANEPRPDAFNRCVHTHSRRILPIVDAPSTQGGLQSVSSRGL